MPNRAVNLEQMANYFQLIPINGTEPEGLSHVDERICKEVLKCDPHPKWFGGEVFDWYNTIGYWLAAGRTLEDGEGSVRKHFKDDSDDVWKEELPLIEKVIDFLQKNYTVKNWFTW